MKIGIGINYFIYLFMKFLYQFFEEEISYSFILKMEKVRQKEVKVIYLIRLVVSQGLYLGSLVVEFFFSFFVFKFFYLVFCMQVYIIYRFLGLQFYFRVREVGVVSLSYDDVAVFEFVSVYGLLYFFELFFLRI